MRTFAKLGNWNMLEQELLKSFFETKRDGRVYALAAGYLEMMASKRARWKEKAKGISTLTQPGSSKGLMSGGWCPALGLKAVWKS